MERSTMSVLLSIAVLAGFFFPFFTWHSFEMSGLNYILSDHIPAYKYFLVSIPIISILILLKTVYKDDFRFSVKTISWILPITLASVFILRFIFSSSDEPAGLSTTSMGFWVTLFFSLVLVIVEHKKDPALQQ